MISILKEGLKNHTLCEIYANTERTDKFFVGYVISIDEQNCVLSAIDPYGQYDGLACFCIDEIYRIQTKTQYLQAMEKLVNFRNTTTKKEYFQENLLVNMLLDICRQKRICEVELCGSNVANVTGYVTEVNLPDNAAKLRLVDEFGNNDGETIIDIQTISSLTFDSTDTVKLEILNK